MVRAVGKIVKLERFQLERTLQLNELPCIKNNFERTFELKAFQLFFPTTCMPADLMTGGQ